MELHNSSLQLYVHVCMCVYIYIYTHIYEKYLLQKDDYVLAIIILC